MYINNQCLINKTIQTANIDTHPSLLALFIITEKLVSRSRYTKELNLKTYKSTLNYNALIPHIQIN